MIFCVNGYSYFANLSLWLHLLRIIHNTYTALVASSLFICQASFYSYQYQRTKSRPEFCRSCPRCILYGWTRRDPLRPLIPIHRKLMRASNWWKERSFYAITQLHISCWLLCHDNKVMLCMQTKCSWEGLIQLYYFRQADGWWMKNRTESFVQKLSGRSLYIFGFYQVNKLILSSSISESIAPFIRSFWIRKWISRGHILLLGKIVIDYVDTLKECNGGNKRLCKKERLKLISI